MYDITARFILLIGGIYNLYYAIFNKELLKNNDIRRGLYLIVGLCALYFITNRDYYLPFLGKTVVIIPKTQNKPGNINLKLNKLPPNTNVIFWASKPSKEISPDFITAYSETENTGYAKTDENGEVIISINCPGVYTVPIAGKLLQHVHYRFEVPNKPGMLSRVYTKMLDVPC